MAQQLLAKPPTSPADAASARRGPPRSPATSLSSRPATPPRTRSAPTPATSRELAAWAGAMGIDDPAEAPLSPAPRLRRRARRPQARALERRPQARGRPRLLRPPHPSRDRVAEPGRAAPQPALGLAPPARPRPRRGARPARAGAVVDSAGGARPGDARARLFLGPALRRARRQRRRLHRLRERDHPDSRQGPQGAHRPARGAGSAGRLRVRGAVPAGARLRSRRARTAALQERPPALARPTSPGGSTAGFARQRSPVASRRTRSATPSRPTCSRAGPTSARSRSCSATRASRRPRSTPESSRAGSATPTQTPIPVPEPRVAEAHASAACSRARIP